MREHKIMVQFDVQSGDRTWTLWIEAMRPTEQWVRLLYHVHGDNSPSLGITVAEMADSDRVYFFLDQVRDFNNEDPDGLAAKMLNTLLHSANESAPDDVVANFKYRVCEWICDERRRAMTDAEEA